MAAQKLFTLIRERMWTYEDAQTPAHAHQNITPVSARHACVMSDSVTWASAIEKHMTSAALRPLLINSCRGLWEASASFICHCWSVHRCEVLRCVCPVCATTSFTQLTIHINEALWSHECYHLRRQNLWQSQAGDNQWYHFWHHSSHWKWKDRSRALHCGIR